MANGWTPQQIAVLRKQKVLSVVAGFAMGSIAMGLTWLLLPKKKEESKYDENSI